MAGKIEGTVVAISETGNLVTDISAAALAHVPRDDRVTICCDEHETTGIFGSNHNQPDATLIAVLGPEGRLELLLVGDSAKVMLGVGVGERVEVRW